MDLDENNSQREDDEGSCLDDLSSCASSVNGEDRPKLNNKKKIDIENNENTIFVGNLPNSTSKNQLKKLFRTFGKIANARLRSAIRKELKTPKKLAVIKKEFHEDSTSINAYVKFQNFESCQKALEMNGKLHEGHHLRVTLAESESKSDPKKSIFVGNLVFKLHDDDLWSAFEDCGAIESVRVIRDQKTGIGKGFGYVNFRSADAVELALKLNGMPIEERPVRISRVSNTHNTSQNPQKRPEFQSRGGIKQQPKKNKPNKSKVHESSVKSKVKNEFQGKRTKPSIHKKTKKKKTKFDKKKIIIKQIAEGMKKKN